jgi:hypothetical protein
MIAGASARSEIKPRSEQHGMLALSAPPGVA